MSFYRVRKSVTLGHMRSFQNQWDKLEECRPVVLNKGYIFEFPEGKYCIYGIIYPVGA